MRLNGQAVRHWSCSECPTRGRQIGRGALRVVCSPACGKARFNRQRAERNLARASGPLHDRGRRGGRHATLHPVEIVELSDRIRRARPGERRAAIRAAAVDYGVSTRTIDRYLNLSHVEPVQVGDFICWFALRRRARGVEPVQLTGWERSIA